MPRDELVDHCLELLGALGPARTRRMFGGHGFYVDDVFIALIAQGRLYLKTDDDSRPQFAAEGGVPFAFTGKAGEAVVTGYWSAPDAAMESPALMLPWARLAMRSALRAANSKRPAKPRKAQAVPRKAAAGQRRPPRA